VGFVLRMRIQKTSQIITAGVIALSALSVASALVARQYRIQQRQAYEQRLSALTFADQLALGSDRLIAAKKNFDQLMSLEKQAFATAERKDDGIIATAISFRGMTARKRNEQALAASEDLSA
jgi:hypothetical protein